MSDHIAWLLLPALPFSSPDKTPVHCLFQNTWLKVFEIKIYVWWSFSNSQLCLCNFCDSIFYEDEMDEKYFLVHKFWRLIISRRKS